MSVPLTLLSKKERYAWVDVMRIFGVFAVYIGHLVPNTGRLFEFVYQYHVPLFFLISGFFSSSSLNVSFFENVRRKAKNLLLPYAVFCLMNILFLTVVHSGYITVATIIEMFLQSIMGIRNHLFAISLWFFPCLFVVSVLFDLLLRIIRRYAVKRFSLYALIVSVISFTVTQIWPFHNPGSSPSWFFNIDSALYYVIYYSIGSFLFKYVANATFHSLTRLKKILFVVASLLSLSFTLLVLIKGSNSLIQMLPFNIPVFLNIFTPVIIALPIIFSNFLFAKLISNYGLFAIIGEEALIFCGTEDIIKTTFAYVLAMAGLSFDFKVSFVAILYTIFILIISHFVIVPSVKKVLSKVQRLTSDLFASSPSKS